MNWLFYMGGWWRVRKAEAMNVFELLADGSCSILHVTRDMLRRIMRIHWGIS
jgi:hypothetical protein